MFTTIENLYPASFNGHLADVKIQQPTVQQHQRTFEAKLLKQEEKFMLDEQLIAANGWLDAEGQLYACPWRHHAYLTVHLGFNSERDLEELGWIKLSQCVFLLNGRYTKSKLTTAQCETIERWHDSNDIDKAYFHEQQKAL